MVYIYIYIYSHEKLICCVFNSLIFSSSIVYRIPNLASAKSRDYRYSTHCDQHRDEPSSSSTATASNASADVFHVSVCMSARYGLPSWLPNSVATTPAGPQQQPAARATVPAGAQTNQTPGPQKAQPGLGAPCEPATISKPNQDDLWIINHK